MGSLCIKGTEESSLEVDSSVPLMHHDPKDLGLICLVMKRKIYFRIFSDFRIQSWIFLKKRTLRVRFFKKIQDWILKSQRIRKWILRFFTRHINPRSFGSWCIKGTEESSLEVDSSVPWMHHDPKDLGLICLVKKRKIYFRILSDSFRF